MIEQKQINNPNVDFWRDASTYGLYFGFMMFGAAALRPLFGISPSGETAQILSYIDIVIMIGGLYWFGKMRSDKSIGKSYSFGQAYVFCLSLMLFASIISSLGGFILNNYIAPEYYDSVMESARLTSIETANQTGPEMKEVIATMEMLMADPLVLTIYGMFGGILAGGFLGLFISPFLVRKIIYRENKEE